MLRRGGDRSWLWWWMGGGERENEAVFLQNLLTSHPTPIFNGLLGAEDVSFVKSVLDEVIEQNLSFPKPFHF